MSKGAWGRVGAFSAIIKFSDGSRQVRVAYLKVSIPLRL